MTIQNELLFPRHGRLRRFDGRVAAYMRMSTDDQRYSLQNQENVIRGYAAMRKLDLVRFYVDPGRSGLDLKGRPGLQKLLTDILDGNADFSRILVYNVSRWGRFQEIDEAAFYEHLCRRCGVRVVYCAEEFGEEDSPVHALYKALSRVDAAKFSRDKSALISACRRIAAHRGYNQGGGAPYGLRRVVLDARGKRLLRLRTGQRKAINEYHVSLEPGPAIEIAVVKDVFRMFVDEGMSAQAVANALNTRRVKTQHGLRWHHSSITYMLSNEKYIGAQVYNRTSSKLKTPVRRNDPDTWIRVPGAFKGIVDPTIFWRAQQIRKARAEPRSNEQLLEELRTFYDAHGPIAGRHFKANGLAHAISYSGRFGSVQKAYALIGVTDLPGHMMCDDQRVRRAHREDFANRIKVLIESDASTVSVDRCARVLLIGDRLRVRFDLLKAYPTMSGALRWRIRLHDRRRTDLYLVARFDASDAFIDFYVLPVDIVSADSFMLYLSNGPEFDQYRCATVEAVAARLCRQRALLPSK